MEMARQQDSVPLYAPTTADGQDEIHNGPTTHNDTQEALPTITEEDEPKAATKEEDKEGQQSEPAKDDDHKE